MYLGGMGRTGKSRAISAIVAFFKIRKEEYRFMILGPTVSTAALLNSSTYHSVFKILRETKSKNKEDINRIFNKASAMATVNEWIQGVEYIFLDKVSMVSCNDLQVLASQAAEARNIYDAEFGRLNVILAGDFGQLPPTRGSALYDSKVGCQKTAGLNQWGQNAVLSKILWHLFTTVVLL
jgi:ATP-dependent DNA helicase PIF1